MRIGTKSVLYGAHCASGSSLVPRRRLVETLRVPVGHSFVVCLRLHDVGYFFKERHGRTATGKHTWSLAPESWPYSSVSPGARSQPHIPDIGRSGTAGNSPDFAWPTNWHSCSRRPGCICRWRGLLANSPSTCFERRNDKPVANTSRPSNLRNSIPRTHGNG